MRNHFVLSFGAIKRKNIYLILQNGKSNHRKVYNEYSYPIHPLERDHKRKRLQLAKEIIIINSEGGGEKGD